MSQQDPTGIDSIGGEVWSEEVSLDNIAHLQALQDLSSQTLAQTMTQALGQTVSQALNQTLNQTDPGIASVNQQLGFNPQIPQIPQNPQIPQIPPINLAKKAVSGRYRCTQNAFQVELRVDVDRTRPMNRVSGDFYQMNGATLSYFGSFVIDAPAISVTNTLVTIKGLGKYTFSAACPVLQISIQRRTIFQPQAEAIMQFFTPSGSPGANYNCSFESIRFRTVRIETDRVSDLSTPVFNSYNTASLPSGGAARSLSVESAYAEAGIEMLPTPASDVIDISAAGGNSKWSNAELHASMQSHFSLWQDTPQWAVWQVAAQLHEMGSGLYGIMFDQQGKQRQGCAVFHQGIGGTTPEKLRLQLYTYVHELGHAFNLLHSWQKSLATPAKPNRPLALSWMNYPFNYPAPGGEATYWSQFAFQFDNEEIIHLRHAFRNDIVMGANNFAIGSSLGREIMADPVHNHSGLHFSISTHQKKFLLGEPVVLQLALSSSESRSQKVHSWLHPNCNLVKIIISKPNGVVLAYEPYIEHLVGSRETSIGRDDVLRDSAYIGYGKDGLYFDQPGNYQIRAAYRAIDGSEILSEIITIRVSYPVTAVEEELAELFMGDEQGKLLYMLGSDEEGLRNGNDAFNLVLSKHAKHPMAQYARLLKGVNAARNFKTIHDDMSNRVSVRKSQIAESAELLTTVANAEILDAVSHQMVLATLVEVHNRGGNKDAAKEFSGKLSAISAKTPMMSKKHLKNHLQH